MIVEELPRRVEQEGTLAPCGPVVVLLSGGRDSVCALDVGARLRGPAAVTALHVNYGLRDDAGADERHCVELCGELGIAVRVERPRRPEGPGNLQAWARDIRYAAAARVALAANAVVVTGHTADDQVETILYRLASSPSRRALLGMRPRDGALRRPLLTATRAETTAYCRERGLAWRDDPTNAGDDYARNRIRNGLLPELARVHPAAAANVLRTAALLRDEAEVLDALVDAELGADREPGIAADRFRRLSPALSRLVLQRLADGAGGRPAAGAARFAAQVAEMGGGGDARLDLGGGVSARIRAGRLTAERGGADERSPSP